jgi:aspartate aminotransferase
LNPGDEVIVPVPYWVSYPPIVELAGGIAKYLNSNADKSFALDLKALASMINSRTKAIILNSPSNPTGAVYTTEDLKAVAKLAAEHNFLIITDDIYDQIRFDDKGPENIVSVVPEIKDHVLMVNSFSKTYAMTGWRIGYLAGPETIVKAATKIQSQSTSNPNSIAQKAALAALCGPQDDVLKMKEAFRTRKNYIMERLKNIPGISCVEPQGAFYVFPDLSFYYGANTSGQTINDSVTMADYLLERAQIAGVPGIAFGDDRFIRFSYATDLSVIKEGMDRLGAALSELKEN